MDIIHIERLGGLAGFGGAHLKSRGEIALADLSEPDKAAVAALFADEAARRDSPEDSLARDGFRYRLTRRTKTGIAEIEVHESKIPAALTARVKDVIE